MPWYTFKPSDPRTKQLIEHFDITGIPILVVLDAKTGFKITDRARKDLKKPVEDVLNNWRKLFEINRIRAVKRSKEDAIAEEERLQREAEEKAKKEAEKRKQEMAEKAGVGAVIV